MHAAVVLLNGSLALWARFRVRQNPIHVLRLRAVLYQPLPHDIAVDRPVRLLVAVPTEHMAAAARQAERQGIEGTGACIISPYHCTLP